MTGFFPLILPVNYSLKHFNTSSLKGFGVEGINNGIIAAGAALHYLFETHHDKLSHINKISRIDEGKYVWLDKFTIRNLELIYPLSPGATTLLNIIDKTDSQMGARLMRRWISLPLKDIDSINERLNIVEYLINDESIASSISSGNKKIGDLERLIYQSCYLTSKSS